MVPIEKVKARVRKLNNIIWEEKVKALDIPLNENGDTLIVSNEKDLRKLFRLQTKFLDIKRID